jgi:hypothetical protein
MIDITQDIQPLTTFRNNSVKMLKQLKRTGRPIVLTVNGKAIRQGRRRSLGSLLSHQSISDRVLRDGHALKRAKEVE